MERGPYQPALDCAEKSTFTVLSPQYLWAVCYSCYISYPDCCNELLVYMRYKTQLPFPNFSCPITHQVVWNLKYCFVISFLYQLGHCLFRVSYFIFEFWNSVLNGLPDSPPWIYYPFAVKDIFLKRQQSILLLLKFSKVSPLFPGWIPTPLSGPKVLYHLLFYLLAGLANQNAILTIHRTAAHLSATSYCPLHLECFPNQIDLMNSCLIFKTQTRQHLSYDNFPDSPNQW